MDTGIKVLGTLILLSMCVNATSYDIGESISQIIVNESGHRLTDLTCNISIKETGYHQIIPERDTWINSTIFIVYKEQMTHLGDGEYVYPLPMYLDGTMTYSYDIYCIGSNYAASYYDAFVIGGASEEERQGEDEEEDSSNIIENIFKRLLGGKGVVFDSVMDIEGEGEKNLPSFVNFIKGAMGSLKTLLASPVNFINTSLIPYINSFIKEFIMAWFLFFFLVEAFIMYYSIPSSDNGVDIIVKFVRYNMIVAANIIIIGTFILNAFKTVFNLVMDMIRMVLGLIPGIY